MKPYYEDASCTIYHADAMTALFEGVRADVAVTDPPYGIGLDYGTVVDDGEAVAAGARVVSVLLTTCLRVAVTPGVANIHAYPKPKWTLCWYVPAGCGSSSWGFCTWQPVLVYGADPYLAAGMGRRPDSVSLTEASDPAGLIGHPCPKPLGFMRWLIQRVSVDENESILDPFMGSGTTLRAAKDLGRKAIGIEIEERYCEIAARRLAQEVLDFGGAA